MFDIFVHGRFDEVKEGFEEGGYQGGTWVSDIVDDDYAFCLFEDFEDVDWIRVVRSLVGIKVLKLFEKQFKDLLLVNSAQERMVDFKLRCAEWSVGGTYS